jgi:hypothetical protein
MTIRAVILWIHVLCGVVWVGACATFLLAVAALAGEHKESNAFAVKIAPQVNRLCLPLAVAIPVTGIGNLWFAAQARGQALPAEFVGIVAAKVGLLAAMLVALSSAWSATPRLHGQACTAPFEPQSDFYVRRIIALHGLMAGMGVMALGLGLWLSGT